MTNHSPPGAEVSLLQSDPEFRLSGLRATEPGSPPRFSGIPLLLETAPLQSVDAIVHLGEQEVARDKRTLGDGRNVRQPVE